MSIELIRAFSEAFGPPGFEDDVLALAQQHAPPGYATQRDSLLNFYLQKQPIEGLPTLMLDAHSDEVGLMVRAIKNDGSIVCTALGGWVPSTLVAQRMLVQTRTGERITGVIAAKPPHFGKEEPAAIDQLVLDIGASSKDEVLALGIAPGCPVVPQSAFKQRGDLLFGKAFDDRLGCAAVLEVLHKLQDKSLDVNVVGTLSSQEEMGLRGAKVSVNRVQPDVAICLEGAPADDTLGDPQLSQTALGRGPMIRLIDNSMIANPRFTTLVLDIAAQHNIPVQQAIRTGGSTNGGVLHLANLGVPTVVIACPVRYAHSHNGIANLQDYRHMVQLTVALIQSLNHELIAGF
ncbi:MAG: M20/M25/M40 family metallo-hydrolase [Oscillospiraceae bacterium]|nr:M20/M25/M40 family metallo-hydrolase [Oscillospiraceae bacterium]